ncbi:MAG TPA: hypothetical protein VHY37_02885 [Tepidisphaeraceae bacterium]|nr:hypothetical protein [Tepidisphaeraceae bacterium]
MNQGMIGMLACLSVIQRRTASTWAAVVRRSIAAGEPTGTLSYLNWTA